MVKFFLKVINDDRVNKKLMVHYFSVEVGSIGIFLAYRHGGKEGSTTTQDDGKVCVTTDFCCMYFIFVRGQNHFSVLPSYSVDASR